MYMVIFVLYYFDFFKFLKTGCSAFYSLDLSGLDTHDETVLLDRGISLPYGLVIFKVSKLCPYKSLENNGSILNRLYTREDMVHYYSKHFLISLPLFNLVTFVLLNT